jgi:hypothetical protein
MFQFVMNIFEVEMYSILSFKATALVPNLAFSAHRALYSVVEGNRRPPSQLLLLLVLLL